jgi:hypothetical protein
VVACTFAERVLLLDREALLEERVFGDRVVVDLRAVPVDFFATVVRDAPVFLGDFFATDALAVLFFAVPFFAVRVTLVVDVFFAM